MRTRETRTPQSPLQRLTRAEVDQFFQKGYLIKDDVFEREDLDALIGEIDNQVRTIARKLCETGHLQNAYEKESFHTQLARIYEESREAGSEVIGTIEGKGGGGQHGIEMYHMITHPKLLACLEDLIGPEIVASSVFRLRPKIPNSGRGIVPWHQDSGYMQEHCDREVIVTCWIPLVDATVENGCMQIMPNCHQSGILEHHTGGNRHFLVIHDETLPEELRDQVVTASVPKGGVVFMTNLTPHCSTPNTSEGVRWSIDLRYQSKEVPNNAEVLPEERPADEQDVKIQMACYPPEADFVVFSGENPSKVTTYEEFKERRSAYGRSKSLPRVNRGWTPADSAKV